MTDLQKAVDEMSRELREQGKGAEEERSRIIAYLRRDAENSRDADVLKDYADFIEAGFHWDRTPEEADEDNEERAALRSRSRAPRARDTHRMAETPSRLGAKHE